MNPSRVAPVGSSNAKLLQLFAPPDIEVTDVTQFTREERSVREIPIRTTHDDVAPIDGDQGVPAPINLKEMDEDYGRIVIIPVPKLDVL